MQRAESGHGAEKCGRIVLSTVVFFGAVALPHPGTSARAAEPGHAGAVRLNRVIELFESNQPAFGVFSSGRTPRNAIALAKSPLDFVVIDMEHAPLDFDTLQTFLLATIDKGRALEKGHAQPDVVPFVRLPQNGREQFQFIIKQALDLGAYGLMLPHIETADEAMAAVRAARYAQPRGVADFEPAGQRGAGYGYPAHIWGIPSSLYIARADVWPHDARGEVLLMMQIESKRGVDNVEEILSVPGVGSIFIGPADLRLSLGVGRDHSDLEAAIQRVLAACKAKGVPCGITADAHDVKTRLAQGFRFFALGGDTGPSARSTKAVHAALRASGRPLPEP